MKKNFLKILNNSQFAKFAKFRMKNHFFLDKHYQQLFGYTLSLHWWYSIPRLVWFGQLLDPMKKIFCKILKNSPFAKFAKFRMKNHFFLGKLNQYFLLYTVITLHYTGDTQCRVWFDLGNSLTRWKTTFCKILKNSQFEKFAKFRMKPRFFPGELYQQFFGFTLSLHWWYSIPSLVWFGQLLDLMENNYF